MTRKEKVIKLREITSQLKTEFVGLDSIIEDIVKTIYPWYVTPEVIERPIVVSIWGMTGTGKTSVVKRLVELLDMRSLIMDVGEEANETNSYNVNEALGNFINGGDIDDNKLIRLKEDQPGDIFVFDEFQYARTIDEAGLEVNKSALRPIWSLIDSGIIESDEYIWGQATFKSFVSEFSDFCKLHGNTKVNHCMLDEKGVIEEFIDTLGFFFYDRNPMGDKMNVTIDKYRSPSKDDEEKEDPYKPINVMALANGNITGLIMRKMNSYKSGEGKITLERIYEAKTLGEICEILKDVEKIISAPKKIDCHKSLVFIIGNLDEAFKVEENLSPDIDANTFNDITSKVSIHDIKTALTKRFRAEQVARLGNNLIKYPTLRQEHFLQIIEKEFNRIINKYEEIEGVKVNYFQDIVELAYSEGVFPTQGVRPIFTTIGTLFTPLLSDISIDLDGEKEVCLEVKSDYPSSLGYKVPEVKVIIHYSEEKKKEIPIKLTLGTSRYPRNRVRRFSTSVHEVGHAILASWCTGIIPSRIVSVSTDDGGFCETYDKKLDREIPSIEDITNEVMICMAGYMAENLVFGKHNPSSILVGSGSDIERAWDTLNTSIYRNGFLGFTPYSNTSVQARTTDACPMGFTTNVEPIIEKLWKDLGTEVDRILKQESKLLKEAALILTEVGCIGENEFLDLIKQHGNLLTPEHIQEKKNKEDWYRQKLEEFGKA